MRLIDFLTEYREAVEEAKESAKKRQNKQTFKKPHIKRRR